MTDVGIERLKAAREGWKEAQKEFAAAFGDERAAGLRALLREVSATDLPAESADELAKHGQSAMIRSDAAQLSIRRTQ